MIVTRARFGILMAMLFCTFGCKGAGQALRVVGAVAYAAARVGVAAAAAGASSKGSPVTSSGSSSEPQRDTYNATPRCAELTTTGQVRTVPCEGPVLVQDPVTGVWHD